MLKRDKSFNPGKGEKALVKRVQSNIKKFASKRNKKIK